MRWSSSCIRSLPSLSLPKYLEWRQQYEGKTDFHELLTKLSPLAEMGVYSPDMLVDLLPQVSYLAFWQKLQLFSQYYKRLFPYSQYARWLQYGNVDKNYMANRLNFYWTAEWSTPITSLCWCLIILIPGSFRSLLLTTSTSATWASQELRILKRRWSKGLTPPSPSFQYNEYKS